ncbi:MAG: hypothetical protein VSS75_024800 [Candidatus Parabeggiatoa sp.]
MDWDANEGKQKKGATLIKNAILFAWGAILADKLGVLLEMRFFLQNAIFFEKC